MGAPPGYEGYAEGGQLTEAVRRKPYSVVLLDEFEKAHREVGTLLLQVQPPRNDHHVTTTHRVVGCCRCGGRGAAPYHVAASLWQVMDEGTLTDSHGKRVDFRNSLIVMTSNLGAEALAGLAEGQPSEAARPEVMAAVAKALPPEFVNRIDSIVLFNRLSRAQIHQIVRFELAKVERRLGQHALSLEVSEPAVSWLSEVGYDPAYGARPVGRAVRQHLLNPLARALISQEAAGEGAGGGGGDGGEGEGAARTEVLVDVSGRGGDDALDIRLRAPGAPP